MTGKLEVRRFQRGDEEALSELFYETFGDGKSLDYWNWKYWTNPAGEHMTVVALDGPRIVGNLGGVPARMKAGSATLLGNQRVDSVIAPDHRIVTTAFQLVGATAQLMTEKNVHFTYTFTNKETYSINTQVLGFHEVCPIFCMSKVMNPAPYLEKKLRMGFLTKPLGIAGKQAMTRINKKRLSIPEGLRVTEITHFDNRFDDLWHRESEAYEVAVVRDSEYLNWRYIESPMPYKIFGVETDEAVKGFVVLGCYRQDVFRGLIVDILAEKGQAGVVDLLLTQAINYFIDQTVDVIMCWMLEHCPVFSGLEKRGFVPRKTDHHLMVHSYVAESTNEYLADKSRWYVTMGDSDYF